MAQGVSSNQALFTCSICLDLLKDPVTVPCGHNYCMGCIKRRWDQGYQKGVYSCPQCKQTFTPRPVLSKINVFAELVEQFKKTRIPDTIQSLAGPEDVGCDSCTGRKLKAVKSCLVCLVSYCETHLQRHDELFVGKRHNVVNATGQLHEKICVQHQKLLEAFCRTDQSCACLLCLVGEHKGHDIVSAAAERMEKQKQMGKNKRKYQEIIQEREKLLQELRKAVETLKSYAWATLDESERMFTEMIRSIERKRSEVTEMIKAQEKAEVSRAEGLQKRLEEEIAELKRRDAELEQLSHTEDHIHFLKNFQSVCTPPQSKDLSCLYVKQTVSFEAVKKSVSTMKGQLNDILKKEVINIFEKVSDVQAVVTEPVTRQEFLKYSCHITLDPNTANRSLHLSMSERRVEYKEDNSQSYPEHPDRFDAFSQVLCREGVSGCCYWEVEWSEWVNIAVSYKSISRKGKDYDSVFGYNDQSWNLVLRRTQSSFWHNHKETKLPLVASSRIGVYVDHRAGTLAFYSISGTMTLLHRVQTTFTQPLYPGFLVGGNSSVRLL